MTSFKQKKTIKPQIQAACFGGMAIVGIIGAKFIAKDPLTIWLIAASCLLLFSIMNNVQSIFAENFKTYLIHSVYSFMFLLIGLGLIASSLSGMSIFDAGAYRTIFIVILISNFIFISMVMMVKGLLIILQEKDKDL